MKFIFIFLILCAPVLSLAAEEPILTRDEMDALVPEDRAAVVKEFRRLDRSCTQISGENSSCGTIQSIPNGDPSFNDPDFSSIPRGADIRVETRCNYTDKKFYANVRYKGADGKWHHFTNPYNGQRNWLTSTLLPGFSCRL